MEDFLRLVPVDGRHHVKIEIDFHIGVLFAEVMPLTTKVLVRVHDLIGGNGISDAC